MRIRAIRIAVWLILGVVYLAAIGFQAWTLTGRSVPGTILTMCALPVMVAPVVWFVWKTRSMTDHRPALSHPGQEAGAGEGPQVYPGRGPT